MLIAPPLTSVVTSGSLSSTTTTAGGSSNMDKLELARKLAQKINFQHQHNAAAANQQNTASQQAAEYIMKGGVIQPAISAKTVAEQVISFKFCSSHLLSVL